MRSLTILAALMLTACATTPEEQAARKRAEMEQMIAIYGPACARLGYQPNSDQWRSCILNLSTKDDLRYYSYPPYYGGWGPGWRGGSWGPYW